MKQSHGKLGIREYVSIAILMIGTKATEDTPAYIFHQVKNAGWMVPLLSAALFFIPLFLLIKTLTLFKDKHLFAVIQTLLGRYIGFVVCLLIFLISSYTISFDSRTYTDIIRVFYFPTTPNLIIYAILMAVCAYGAKKGLQHVGSVSYLVVFYVIVFVNLALYLSSKESTLQSIFPIWGPGKWEILKQGTKRLNLFADFFLFAMLIPYFKSFNTFKKGTWIAYLFVSIQLSVAFFVYICMFDISLGASGYPFHTAIRYISLGSFLPNVEITFFVTWLLSSFIRFTAFLYINAIMFGHLFKIKDFEYLIPSLATIYLLIGSLPESPMNVSLDYKALIQDISGPISVAIMVILWLAALIKGEFKHAKNRNSM